MIREYCHIVYIVKKFPIAQWLAVFSIYVQTIVIYKVNMFKYNCPTDETLLNSEILFVRFSVSKLL